MRKAKRYSAGGGFEVGEGKASDGDTRGDAIPEESAAWPIAIACERGQNAGTDVLGQTEAAQTEAAQQDWALAYLGAVDETIGFLT